MAALAGPLQRQGGVGRKSDAVMAFLLVAPILLTMGGLVFYPLVSTAWDSLHRVNPMYPGTPFVGLANYAKVFRDAETGRS